MKRICLFFIFMCSTLMADIFSDLEKQCDKRDFEACYIVANMYEEDYKSPESIKIATSYYEIACKNDHTKSCGNIGYLYFAQKDFKSSLGYFQKGCDLGDMFSCAYLGSIYYSGLDVVESDKSAGIKYLDMACDANMPSACERLSGIYNQDFELSLKYQNRMCDINRAKNGCDTWGYLFQRSDDIAKDERYVPKFYELACDARNIKSCNKAGVFIISNLGPRLMQDYKAALEYYKKICSMGNGSGCGYVGFLYLGGLGVAEDISEAFEYFKKGCDLNDANSCLGMGNLYDVGDGIQKDYSKATKYYEQACENGSKLGCNNAGIMYQYGYGIDADLIKSKDYHGKGCSMKYVKSCVDFGVVERLLRRTK